MTPEAAARRTRNRRWRFAEVNACFAAIAAIEGRHARKRKLDALRELLERASALEGQVHREDSHPRDAPRDERGRDDRGDRQ